MKKLEIYHTDNYILNDAFDQAVMNIHIAKKQNNYKSFVITGCEAGDGATTISINLAVALANSGWKTVMVDGDMRKKNRYKRLNENVEGGLSDCLTSDKKIDDVVYETDIENFYYIPCGELVNNPVRVLCSAKMQETIDALNDKYDFVIFDMPAVNAAMDAKVLAVNVDATILVSAIGKTSKKGLYEAANALTSANANLIGTIINKTDMEQYKFYNEEYDYFAMERYAKKQSIVGRKKK